MNIQDFIDENYTHTITELNMPSENSDEEQQAMLSDAMNAGVVEIEDCGCTVELDGTCPCGNESPFLTLGLI